MIELKAKALGLAFVLAACAAPAHAAQDPLEAQEEDPSEAQKIVVAVEEALKRHAPDAHRCLEVAAADSLAISGKMQIEVNVGAGGKVGKVKLLSKDDKISVSMADCVVSAAGQWRIDGIEPGASVILPLTFSALSNQFVVKEEDAPPRGPQAGGKRQPPFAVKIIADADNVRAQGFAVTHLTVAPANRVAMTRHPKQGKILVLLRGRARILGAKGDTPVAMMEKTAVFIPAGYPHVIENMGRQISAEMLQIFAPGGPERAYRDPRNPQARTDFEVIRGQPPAPPKGAAIQSVRGQDVAVVPILDSKAGVQILLDPAVTGSNLIAVNWVEFEPHAKIAKHTHANSEEFVYVVEGGGTLHIGAENIAFKGASGIYIPKGQTHGVTFGAEKTLAVQVFSPAGPEQQFKPKPQ